MGQPFLTASFPRLTSAFLLASEWPRLHLGAFLWVFLVTDVSEKPLIRSPCF